MITKVVTATPSTPFKQLVELLTVNRIGGVPVVDEDRRVLGVVSEADLLLKQEDPRDQRPGLGERLLHRADQARAHGTVARDFMRSPATTIGEDATLAQAARLMDARHIKRLPVVVGTGRLVGIVGRADLLRVFLRSDEEIQAEIRTGVIRRQMGMDPARFFVDVDRGVVTLEGRTVRAARPDPDPGAAGLRGRRGRARRPAPGLGPRRHAAPPSAVQLPRPMTRHRPGPTTKPLPRPDLEGERCPSLRRCC